MSIGPPVLYTVGHGTRSVAELADVIADAAVPLLVDVRHHPGSRRHPHLSRARLEHELPALGIAYEWCEALGGRRTRVTGSRHTAWRNDAFAGYADHMDSEEFRVALDALLGRLPLAVMCAETLWWRCHRRLIADAATLQGVQVVHLLDKGKSQPHPLHESVRRDEEGRPVYNGGQGGWATAAESRPPLPGHQEVFSAKGGPACRPPGARSARRASSACEANQASSERTSRAASTRLRRLDSTSGQPRVLSPQSGLTQI